MICTQLSGGIGNQMFQYVCGRALALKRDSDLILDCSILNNNERSSNETKREYELHVFNVQAKIADNKDIKRHAFSLFYRANIVLHRLTGIPLVANSKNLYEGEFNKYNDKVKQLSKCSSIKGYWQSYKYFESYESVIRSDFQFKNNLIGKNLILANQIKNCNSVGLHIRRGDYVSNTGTFNTHGICSLEYYKDSIKHIIEQVENPVFFVFSDDPKWVTVNLSIDVKILFISENYGRNSYLDMQLMSLCKHNIIANSSFSWWSAWLNRNPDKIIIAPRKWFNIEYLNIQTKDLIPDTWVRL